MGLIKFLGIQRDTTGHKEKFISALGGAISIYFILHISHYFVASNAGLIVASMGASAVLLFAVPHGPLSQPWPLIGGHLFSAIIGVACYIYIPNLYLAASIAVCLSIYVMYYTRCIHPPGGATALSAVLGGSAVHDLGYQYVITPIFINVLVILMVAIIFNFFFVWRRYPAILSKTTQTTKQDNNKNIADQGIPIADLEFALQSMKSFTDISANELELIYHNAKQHKFEQQLQASDILLGHYYLHGDDCNGVITRIIDESNDKKDMVIYKIITGPESKKTLATTRTEFANLIKHEVIHVNNSWVFK